MNLADLYRKNSLPKKRNEIEQDGVRMVGEIMASHYDWVFFEHSQRNDYGIDAFVEIVDEGRVTGKLIAIQIKAGDSYFNEETLEGYRYRGKEKHLAYWLNHSLPVILVLCNLKDKTCYWERIDESTINKQAKGWTTIVNKKNILNIGSMEQLKEIADNRNSYQKRLDSLLVAQPWMDQIISGNRIIVESEEWVNKSSGRGTLRIIIEDNRVGNSRVDKDFGNVYFPMMPYKEIFPKLFPWAKIDIDDEVYEEYELGEYTAGNGYKDEDTGEILLFTEQEDYYYIEREGWERIRPYDIEGGELAKYRLELNINDFGKSFYNVDSYLRGENNMKFLLKEENQVQEETLEEADVCTELKKTLEKIKNIRDNDTTELLRKIELLLSNLKESIEYLKGIVCAGTSPLTYMENELQVLYEILNFKIWFNDKYIRELEGEEEIIKSKKYLVEEINNYFDIEVKLTINRQKENLIDKEIQEELGYKHDDIIEFLNNKYRLEKDNEKLNKLKEESHKYYKEKWLVEEKLEKDIVEFIESYYEFIKHIENKRVKD